MIAPNATDRARLLDQMAAAGRVVPLAWGDLNFDVVIQDFDFDYKHQWQGRYSIECRVLWDYAQAPTVSTPSVDVFNDLSIAQQALTSAAGLAIALSMVTSVQQSAPAPGTLNATQGAIQGALTGIGTSAAASGAQLVSTPALARQHWGALNGQGATQPGARRPTPTPRARRSTGSLCPV